MLAGIKILGCACMKCLGLTGSHRQALANLGLTAQVAQAGDCAEAAGLLRPG